MKRFNYFTLMTLTLLSVAACNEKITPKLLEGNQSTTVPPVIEPEEYFFKVTNTSKDTRNYHLHQSGLGNAGKNCEIKSTDKFTSNLFRDPSRKPEFDISCFFEAEELALSEFGFSFEFEASPNTCEYIAYVPFSFFNFKPGDSSGSLTKISCSADTSVANIPAAMLPIVSGGGRAGCGQMVDDSISAATRLAFTAPQNDEELCRYDYSRRSGPNCDVGIISVKEIEFTYTPATEVGGPDNLGVSESIREINCGGKIGYCVEGPIKQEDGFRPDTTIGVVYYEPEKNMSFKEKREYEKKDDRWGNLYYSNFRRTLANPHIDFGSFSVYAQYVNSFQNMTQIFPSLLDSYSAARLYDGVSVISGTNPSTDGIPNTRNTKAFAAEPFMGVGGYRTSPYYSFYCLDAAREMKGRIKMMVRDWDRFIPSNLSKFDLISDIYEGEYAHIDVRPDPGEDPDGRDNDIFDPLNDVRDWDDFIPMTRSPGALVGNGTQWTPTTPFFHEDLFPKVILED